MIFSNKWVIGVLKLVRLAEHFIKNTTIPAWKLSYDLSEIISKYPGEYPYLKRLFDDLELISEKYIP